MRFGSGIAALCGLALALAFPRASLAPLAWLAPVPWIVLTLGSAPAKAFGRGFSFGLGFFGLLLWWVHGVLRHHTILPLALSLPVWSLLVAYLSLYTALFALALSLAGRRLGMRGLALAPVFWVALEFARGELLGGFPWGAIGSARAGGLPLLQAASVGGVGLVSFLIVAAWSALACLVIVARARGGLGRGFFTRLAGRGPAPATGRGGVQAEPRGGGRAAVLTAAVTLLLVLGTIGLGALRLRAHPVEAARSQADPPSGPSAAEVARGVDRVAGTGGSGSVPPAAVPGVRSDQARSGGLALALIQGGFGGELDYERARQALDEYVRLSRLAARSSPDLIVWPESNAPFQPEGTPGYLPLLAALSRETGALLLIGAVGGNEREGLTNSAYLIGEEGILHRYDKRRLVQYGEYVPLQRWFPFVRKFVQEVGEFRHGERVGVMAVGEHRLGVGICYEMIFSREILDQARSGADILINLTNDSWFPGSGPRQHAAFAALRSVETGLWSARAASTGLSLLVDPFGRERSVGPMGGNWLLEANIPDSELGGGPAPRTFFVATGDWAGRGCAIVSALALAFLALENKIFTRRREQDALTAGGS